MIPFMGETVCWVLALFLLYFSDFAIVNLNSSSNFVIEHFRRTDFHTVLATIRYIPVNFGNASKFF